MHTYQSVLKMKIIEIIDKLRDNSTLSESESDYLMSWLFSEKGRKEFGEEVERHWNTQEEREVYYGNILEKIHLRMSGEAIGRMRKRKTALRYLRYAAVFLVALAGAYIAGRHSGAQMETTYAGMHETVEFYNPRGMRAVVVLPDSTRATLNADTRISYPRQFAGDSREVKLEGEAYFEVAGDKTRPFMVEAGGAKVTALGTEFNLRFYPGDTETEAMLVEGSIRFEAGDTQKILEPGFRAIYNSASGTTDVSHADTDTGIGWMEGKLYFEDMTFGHIAAILERKYSVNIRITDPILAAKSFKGKFEHGENLDQILHVINMSVPLIRKYDEKTNTMTID